MTVRSATADDVEAIRTIARDSWEVDYPEILSRETVDEAVEDWYGKERVTDAIEDPLAFLLVAEPAGNTVGFLHGVLDGETGVILRLYVHPDHRGQGVGTDLFVAIRREFLDHDVDRIEAMVLAANDPGNSFYRHLGMEQVDSGETLIGGKSFTEHTYELPIETS